MEQTWRWYGPNDPVSLVDIKQAGATGIVTALHDIPAGEVWTVDAIQERKKLIVDAGLTWSVVESIPVHEQIKYGGSDRDKFIDAYKQSVRNMGVCGIDILCYNFMPVVDWTRTDLEFEWPVDGSIALRFDRKEFAAFDLHILKRPGAAAGYTPEELAEAETCFNAMNDEKRKQLTYNIIRGLPGSMCNAIDSVELFQKALDNYKDCSEKDVQDNLLYFLKHVVPIAEEAGVFMGIHPDDPPIRLFGLPRVVSTREHVQALLAAKPSIHNGLTMCVGSYASRPDNDIPSMVEEFASNVNFIHLRNVEKDKNSKFFGSFTESDHLTGDIDMFHVMSTMLKEQRRRRAAGRSDLRLPYRPDHGHKMLDDLRKTTNPGYPAVGRLRGLAELRGLELGILKSGILDKKREMEGLVDAADKKAKLQVLSES